MASKAQPGYVHSGDRLGRFHRVSVPCLSFLAAFVFQTTNSEVAKSGTPTRENSCTSSSMTTSSALSRTRLITQA